MALPFLPGNSFNPNLGKGKYHKSHHFDYSNDVAMLMGEAKPGIGGDPLLGQKLKPRNSAIPRGTGSALPAWVAFDRQVLCFDAYFQEAVHEKREEQYRIRNCKIYFYLEDDSVQVIEPRLKNAGIPQGTLIRRHRIPKPPPNDDEFYTVEDFNIGVEMTLYSRTFKITSCDEFTHNFLRKLGVRVRNPDQRPEDPYMGSRKALDESMQPLRPYEKHDTLKQFLDHDRHVLRFFCFWDDTDNMFGDPREMILHYFLADDTMEIREVIPPNSGRDATPMFLRRALLPKNVESLRQPGEHTDRTVLNVFGPTGHGGRYILDSLKTGAVHSDYYKDSDLTLGTVLNVWGRKFVICNCDDFTKEYYRSKFGITNFPTVNYKQGGVSRPPREMPPYNGFGSEEDSLCSCMGLLPKPPKRDFIKFMEKDRRGLDSNVLRFLARMDTDKPIDVDRRFIISYFLSDDTILVFEPPVRNSGIIGGKFLERGRVKKPNQPMYSTQLSEYYTAKDLYVGTRVIFNQHRFELIDADEYAYRYMEAHPQEFRQSDIHTIMDKLKKKIREVDDFAKKNPTLISQEKVSFEDFRAVMRCLMSEVITEHELFTVARWYQDHSDDRLDLQQLVAIVQDQLMRYSWESFSKVLEECIQNDRNQNGYLPKNTILTVCKAFKVPVPYDLLRTLIASMPSDENGQINYMDFVKHIHWSDHPVAPKEVPANAGDDAGWMGTPPHRQLTTINLANFIQDLRQ